MVDRWYEAKQIWFLGLMRMYFVQYMLHIYFRMPERTWHFPVASAYLLYMFNLLSLAGLFMRGETFWSFLAEKSQGWAKDEDQDSLARVSLVGENMI